MEEFPVGTVEALCLGTSLALSGLCYYVYRRKRRPLDRLNEAPHLPLDEKLTDLLNAAPGKCLRYVVIEGAAQPVGEPLRSVFQEGSVGVLQKLMLKEHKLVWNSFARAWMDSERVVHQRVNAVPFSLVGSGQGSGRVTGVRVLSPLEASGLDMEVVHEKFHQASYGFSDMVGMYLSGEKPKGQLETEEMVKVGATLTGVGELILDTDRALKLRPPGDGSPYLLSTADFETLRQDHEREAGAWRALACAFALAALAALLWAGRRYYRGVTRRRERERLTREFLASEEDPGGEDPEASVQNACAVCLVRPRACVMLDCGHVCCCAACARALTAVAMATPLCPICRQSIRRVVPLYQA